MKRQSSSSRALGTLLIVGLSFPALAPAQAADAPKVTAFNYVRAESDIQMKGYIESFNCFGKFHHNREAYDVDNQITIRGNRDTLYSFGVFDLRSPVTITLPETEGRYQSLMIVNQDHSIWSFYGPRTGTLTEEKAGTRYVLQASTGYTIDPAHAQFTIPAPQVGLVPNYADSTYEIQFDSPPAAAIDVTGARQHGHVQVLGVTDKAVGPDLDAIPARSQRIILQGGCSDGFPVHQDLRARHVRGFQEKPVGQAGHG